MKSFLLCCVLIVAALQRSFSQTTHLPETGLYSCEGDILLLLDSSGSVTSFEFSRFLEFIANLLYPFALGRGHLRVALLLVATTPHLEFSLDIHSDLESLLRALESVRRLQGDTNTKAAVEMAHQLLLEVEGDVPKVLLWLTDGIQPGEVEEPMSKLKAQGVHVLIVSTIHGDYNVLQRVATPPLESHLYSVDIDSIDIITDDLREAIIKIICAEQLSVVHLTSHSAVLQWHPVLSSDGGYYELRYKAVGESHPEKSKVLPSTSSRAELTRLQPDTMYTASLRPESNQILFRTLSVKFTTLPVRKDVISPAEVTLSDHGPHQVRVTWGPLQPALVQRYRVEYGAIPSGHVQTVTVSNQRSSVFLRDLDPGTRYLITVSALYVDGKERAMSVTACTQEAPLPPLTDLQLALIDRPEGNEVQATWQANTEGLKGYWINWKKKSSQSSQSEHSLSSAYLPPSTLSTRLTDLASNSRVCVSPLYSFGRGEGICCTARTNSD
ncbi:PREDICTED: von Willebrand factor A domain-containing protein 1 [Cyprinodon variegatus]|uniref:von Willebrand factor A domain-containing protein 1 n=1 Tax=Cyprinodon variegatus TaxID=28743 RepID=A0A3Q2DJT2_CYPVA|nr:PREDICTED: von Willebrand factor A domain-containing protein 1 [Cyprinodon variegatus]